MYKWQVNPNIPTVTAMRTALELLNGSDKPDDSEGEAVRFAIGQQLMLANCFAQLSLLLDKAVQSNLDTPPMVEAMLSALLEMGNLITSMSDLQKACLTSSTPSQWILRNRKTLFHAVVALQDFVDEGLNYHNIE